jgi:hypothetical protein
MDGKEWLDEQCHSLDLECSAKAYMLKAWSPAHCPTGTVWGIEDMEPSMRSSGHSGHAFEGDFGSLVLSFLFSCWDEPFCFTEDSTHDVLPYHKLKSNRVNWSWIVTSKTVSPNKTYLLKSWLSQVFATAKESWPTQASTWAIGLCVLWQDWSWDR